LSDKLKNKAIDLLSRRDHSTWELANKLVQKGFNREDFDRIFQELTQAGYLDDSRLTESYIRWRREKGFGPERIALELASKGVSDSIIAVHIDFADNAWLNEALRVKNKHFKNQSIKDFKVKAKQMRFLKYRGFTNDHIQKAFGEVETE
jgi:regulatory protein